jgi:GT2 family glycosyltransferase
MVSRQTYERVGGFGEDYLDDIEFSLRCFWHGVPLRRFWRVVTRHHGGTDGGLRALPGVQPKRSAHVRLSRLDERYPGRLVRDNRSWWGFRLVRHGLAVA